MRQEQNSPFSEAETSFLKQLERELDEVFGQKRGPTKASSGVTQELIRIVQHATRLGQKTSMHTQDSMPVELKIELDTTAQTTLNEQLPELILTITRGATRISIQSVLGILKNLIPGRKKPKKSKHLSSSTVLILNQEGYIITDEETLKTPTKGRRGQKSARTVKSYTSPEAQHEIQAILKEFRMHLRDICNQKFT